MNSSASTFRHRASWLASGLIGLGALGLGRPGTGIAAIEPLSSIRAAAESFVQAQMPAGQPGIVVSAERLDPRLRLARCAAPLEASLLYGARLSAQTSVAVRCRSGADWTLYVPVTVKSRIHVWALRTAEPQGARLSAQDVTAETRLVSGMSAGYVTDPAQLARSSLRHPLPAGAVLRSGDLLPDFMVRQGEQVTLVASLEGIRVRAAGVALQSGRYGALIRVQNVASSKVVQGVVGTGRVVKVSP